MMNEKIVVGADTKYPLNGILSIPSEPTDLMPAVVLVHGFGPTDMDGSAGNNKTLKDLAEGLAEKGIAVLRYDKRTLIYGHELKGETALSAKEETIEDAIVATELLRQDSRINPNKVFIVGHSLGGMLAPRIDAEGGNFAGIVILNGTPRKFEEILIDQNNAVFSSLNWLMRIIAGRQIATMSAKFHGIYNLSDEEAKSTVVFGRNVRAYYFKEMGERPSSDYLELLEKPLFIIHGEKDFEIPYEKNFNEYKKLLSNRENATFKLYPNLNHLLMPSVYGNLKKAKKEYNVTQHVDQQVINDISDWIFSF